MQGHFGSQTIDIERVTGVIQSLAEFGIPIWVTEFDWFGHNVSDCSADDVG